MSASLPPDEVLEALLAELEVAAARPGGTVDVAALAERHGVPRRLVEDCLVSLQVLAAEATAAGAAPPDRLGPYALLGVLGRGGMGTVYRARHPELDREVALKVLRAGADATPRERARFLREAEALAALRHPNVLTVHEAGQAAAGAYLVLELVEGARPITAAGAERDWRGRVALVRDAARGLGHAHARGVVHRDVKPENLLVDAGGRVRVGDFGLARLPGGERLTQTGAVVGTAGYMAPEQARGDRARQGPPSDVWSLGVVLRELLGGGPPPLAGYPLPALRDLDPELPPTLEAVCRRALADDPAARYPHGDALADDLDAVLEGRPPPGTGAASPRRRAAAAAVGLLVVGLALAVGLRAPGPARPAGPAPGPASPAGPGSSTAPEDPAPWRAEARGPTRADEQLAAWRWLRAHAAHPRAGPARALVTDARRAPLCLLPHAPPPRPPEAPVSVAFDGPDALVTAGGGELARWSVPGGGLLGRWRVPGLQEVRALPGGDWALAGGGAVERWPGRALREEGAAARGPAGPLGGDGRAGRGAAWSARSPDGASGPCAVSPDGRWLAVAAGEAGVLLLGAADGVSRALGAPRRGTPRRLAFTAPDRLVAALERPEGYTLELWDVERGQLLTARPALAVSALAHLPDRGQLALGSHRGTVTLHDPVTLEVQGALGDPALADAAGARVFRGDEAVGQLTPLHGASAVLALPGRDVPAADRALKWLDLARGGGGPVTAPLGAPAHALAVDPDGGLVAVGRRDGRVEVWLLPTAGPR